MRTLIRWFRPDITGDVHHAAALLSRAALVRLERGDSHDQVRAWVAHPRRTARYGPLAMLSVYEVLRAPTRPAPAPVLGCTDPTHGGDIVVTLCCGDCNPVGLARAGYTVAELDALADVDAGQTTPRTLATIALLLMLALAGWVATAPPTTADGRGVLALVVVGVYGLGGRRGVVR